MKKPLTQGQVEGLITSFNVLLEWAEDELLERELSSCRHYAKGAFATSEILALDALRPPYVRPIHYLIESEKLARLRELLDATEEEEV